jgi:hypothetical protein
MAYASEAHCNISPRTGLAPDGERWLVGRQKFFVPTKPLAQLFRAKMPAALGRALPQAGVPAAVWRQAWVVDYQSVGKGEAALKYLAPYIFRVALSNNRIERLTDEQVTFRYTEASTRHPKRCTLPAVTFIQRFLMHVLPKGFVKVRYYGLLRVGRRHLLEQARAALVMPAEACRGTGLPDTGEAMQSSRMAPDVTTCPSCGRAMHLVQTLSPQRVERTELTRLAACSRGPPRKPAE